MLERRTIAKRNLNATISNVQRYQAIVKLKRNIKIRRMKPREGGISRVSRAHGLSRESEARMFRVGVDTYIICAFME